MKASFESLSPAGNHSFLLRRFDEKTFSAPYHYHPELELTLITNGGGKRYVGSNMSTYSAGDLVLLGPHLPHCWKSESATGTEVAGSLVIQFSYDFLGADFFLKTELQAIHTLLEKSRFGIRFSPETAALIEPVMMSIEQETRPFDKLMSFLSLLQNLAETKTYELLDQHHIAYPNSPGERKRINGVMAYIVDNFRDEILLNEAATIAGMTPNAFCKYFKRMTRKTFQVTVMDYRIHYAAQQLVQTDKPVADIGYESGFGDTSHFFKTFKTRKGISPLAYRKQFAEEVG